MGERVGRRVRGWVGGRVGRRVQGRVGRPVRGLSIGFASEWHQTFVVGVEGVRVRVPEDVADLAVRQAAHQVLELRVVVHVRPVRCDLRVPAQTKKESARERTQSDLIDSRGGTWPPSLPRHLHHGDAPGSSSRGTTWPQCRR